MEALELFEGIEESERERMLSCFAPQRRTFSRGETIMNYSRQVERIGILLSGRAHLSCVDSEGQEGFLESLQAQDMFGEMFSLPLPDLGYMVVADAKCEVLFLEYSRVVSCSKSSCAQHSRLINNLFQMAARKAQQLALRVNILSHRSVRVRLMRYLEYLSARDRTRTIDLGMTLVQLADYLCVNRSALMREIKGLNEEKVISSSGRHFELLQAGNAGKED